MSTWILGDLHAEYNKLMDVFEKINFDYENDTLISLGDIVDRGEKSFECVEELLKIKNLKALRGNHDATFRDSILTGEQNLLYNQGGRETVESYVKNCGSINKIPLEHIRFFTETQSNYHIDNENNLFVHGGFNRHYPIEGQSETTLLWDRDLFLAALSFKAMKTKREYFKIKDKFNHIYIGHTPTIFWGIDQPITAANITNMDTGCGKGNYPLTVMNLQTKEVIQSYK